MKWFTVLKENSVKLTYASGFVGTAIVLLAILVTTIPYRGAFGEPYSFLNHNISELGEIGVSELAQVFNLSLILGGLCFVCFMIGFSLFWHRLLVYIISCVGLLAAVGIIMVGLFPVIPGQSLAAHTIAALTFFLCGLLYFLLLTLYLLFTKQNKLPKWFAIPSAVATASYFAFLFLPRLLYSDLGTDQYLAGLSGPQRPVFWLPSFLEWMILWTVLAWILLVSWYFWKNERTTT